MLNKIGMWKATRRTETSKYPEEKKENSIPLVAASEKGKAQTGFIRGSDIQKASEPSRMVWENQPKKVRAL